MRIRIVTTHPFGASDGKVLTDEREMHVCGTKVPTAGSDLAGAAQLLAEPEMFVRRPFGLVGSSQAIDRHPHKGCCLAVAI